VLDDEATAKLPDNTQLVGGTFKPTQGTSNFTDDGNPRPSVFSAPARFAPYGGRLSIFDDTNPNGTWKLFVYEDTTDSSNGGAEFAGGWSIKIRARVVVG
jgi:hypothetical protein